MAEPKPIASLSSGLLARKGAARPAMRRQGLEGMGQLGGTMVPHPLPRSDAGGHDDLGWNDMGYDVDPAHDVHVPDYGNLLAGAIPDALPAGEVDPAAAAAADAAAMEQPPVADVPDVVRQQAEIAERMAEPAGVTVAAPAEEVPAPDGHDGAPEQVLSVRKRRLADPVAEAADLAPAAAPTGRRAAFTLRLDSERHLRLRLATAVTGRSAQQLLIAALDDLLTRIPEIEDLAGRIPRPPER